MKKKRESGKMGSPFTQSLCPGRNRSIKGYSKKKETKENMEEDGY